MTSGIFSWFAYATFSRRFFEVAQPTPNIVGNTRRSQLSFLLPPSVSAVSTAHTRCEAYGSTLEHHIEGFAQK